MKFRIIDLSDGSQKDCSLERLSVSLSPNCVILKVKEDGLESIGLITHHSLAFFAVEFASYALQNYTKKILPKAQTCIDLTRKWLEDQSSVSAEELTTASNAANAASYATNASAYAAYAATNAAYYAAYAANAASNAANAATYAAYAAAKNKRIEENRQATFILNFFGVE